MIFDPQYNDSACLVFHQQNIYLDQVITCAYFCRTYHEIDVYVLVSIIDPISEKVKCDKYQNLAISQKQIIEMIHDKKGEPVTRLR